METRSEPKKKLRSAAYHVAIFLAAAGILIVGAIWRGGGDQSEPRSDSALIEELRNEVAGLRVGMNASELDAIQDTVAEAASTIARSIVAVRPLQGAQALRSIPLYGDIQNQNNVPPSSMELSPGLSGIIIDPSGYVLTSANVARLGQRVQVVFDDGEEREAAVAGIDTEDFLGLLQISSPPSNIVALDVSGAMPELRPGEWLIRQGRSPSGRVSLSLCLLESVRLATTDRPVGFLDRAAAPEIDGGALIDVNGRLVGLYVSPPQAPAFVVPIERALSVGQRLMSVPQRTPQSSVGLELQDLSEDLRDYFEVSGGVLVTRVLANGPAARAGLRSMDIIQTLDKMDIASASQLTAAIAEKPPGTRLEFGIRRNSRTRVVAVVTGPYPANESVTVEEQETLTLKVQDNVVAGGLEIIDASPAGLANRVGLLSGDVITAVNGRLVRRSSELARLVRALPEGKPNLFQIQRGDRIFFIGIKERVTIDE